VHVAVIINPISGTGGRPEIARRRVELATDVLATHAVHSEIIVTERVGHARDAARAAVAAGAGLVAAWGGDGTVNEVASTLAFGPSPLAIIPSGSGNGLARELAIPFDAHAAFEVALHGRDRVIDAGELDGHLFFNVAGIGLDARVAHQFAARGLVRRGFLRYVEITAQELFTYCGDEHTIAADGDVRRESALLIAIANSRQYGNGALIAPHARVDDGRLDIVVVARRSLLSTLISVPRVFTGHIDRVSGVTMRTATDIEITSARPVLYHVDGEPFVGGASIRARVHAKAVRVRVPK
jgi:diacylglycerol kinase (ATP)